VRNGSLGLGRVLQLVGLAAASVPIFIIEYDFMWDDVAPVSLLARRLSGRDNVGELAAERLK
jgi:hypothetical protein